MAFVQMLGTLVRDKNIGKYVVPIVPDESRTFGMEGMFRQLGIWSSVGQLYKPQDADQLMYYREDKSGQVLQEGINEAGAMSSWIAAATSYSTNNLPMIPFYIYYSMFGLQRVGDLAWLAGDMRARGFLLGGTAGRTTLNGEGLQHEDGHSHVLASTIPNCVSYDPTFSYEVVTIIRDGMRRMVQEQEDVFYYITLMNENYPHPAMPAGAEEGIVKGMYLLREGAKGKGPRVQLMGSGTILREVIAAADLLRDDFKVNADVWSVTSFNELRRDGMSAERWNLLHPGKPRRKSYVETALEGHDGPVVASTDYMRNFADQVRSHIPRTLSRARHRRLRPQRLSREAAAVLRGEPLLRRGRRAEGARRRRRDQAGEGRGGDQEVRPRHRAARSLDRLKRLDLGGDMGAMTEVKVPDIGDFKDVPVIEVLVKPGDKVKPEDPLLTLESDKATMDVPAPAAGTVKDIKVKVGDKVSEGSLILLLDSAARARRPPQRALADAVGGRAAGADERAGGRGRSARAGHRRLQGRAGDRGVREARRHREARGAAHLARVRQGDDGRAGAARRRGGRAEGQGRRQGLRRHGDPDAGHRRAAAKAAPAAAAAAAAAAAPAPAPRAPRAAAGTAARTRRRSRSPTPGRACASSRASSASILGAVKGTGKNGRILKEDVESHAKGRAGGARGGAGGCGRGSGRRRHRAAALAEGRLREVRPDRDETARAHQEDLGARTCTATG